MHVTASPLLTDAAGFVCTLPFTVTHPCLMLPCMRALLASASLLVKKASNRSFFCSVLKVSQWCTRRSALSLEPVPCCCSGRRRTQRTGATHQRHWLCVAQCSRLAVAVLQVSGSLRPYRQRAAQASRRSS
jgi:hypothetical protein